MQAGEGLGAEVQLLLLSIRGPGVYRITGVIGTPKSASSATYYRVGPLGGTSRHLVCQGTSRRSRPPACSGLSPEAPAWWEALCTPQPHHHPTGCSLAPSSTVAEAPPSSHRCRAVREEHQTSCALTVFSSSHFQMSPSTGDFPFQEIPPQGRIRGTEKLGPELGIFDNPVGRGK